jgi:monoamine oxidase
VGRANSVDPPVREGQRTLNRADQSVANVPPLRAADALAALHAADTGPRREVLVLGAGMAGLAAAYELQRRGHRVTVLEGSHRVGGRVLTHRFSDGSHVELGAMRVPASHDYTRHYIDVVGLTGTLTDFINMVDENFLDIRGVVCRRSEGAQHLYPLYGIGEANPDPKLYPQYPGGAILGWLVTNLIETMTEVEKQIVIQGGLGSPRLRYLDGLSIGDFMARAASAEVCDLIGAFTCLDDLADKSLSIFIRDSLIGIGGKLQTLRGGMSGLPEGLAAKLAPGTIRFGHEVRGLHIDTPTSTIVRCLAPDGPAEFAAPFVICTIPYSVLRLASLENFGHAKLRAIREMSYVSSTKVGLACRHRFWETGYNIYAGSSVSDGVQRQTYYPMDHARPSPQAVLPHTRRYANIHAAPLGQVRMAPRPDEDPDEPGALLGAYTWGADADALGVLPAEARAERVMRGIARFHPEIADYVTDHASMVWRQNRWSGGAFAYLLPGQLETMYPDAKRPEARVYFAGEHCSAEQAWIQGALTSALEAVYAVLRA